MTSTAKKTFYLTTPIYYVNDVPHPGHAYTTIAADALCRARRLQGHDVFFLTGTDEHGQNIERIAREKGVPEQQYCDMIAARFKALWERLDIRYDGFIRTTDDLHRRGVLKLWERMRTATTPDGQSAVYRGTYQGFYCPRCEAFKTEDEMKQPGNVCPDHERPCEWTTEENFFFRLSGYAAWLQEAIGSNEIRIEPEGRRNEVLSVLRQGLQDFSISRARVKWGIPVPEEPSHVFYVWMDALSNYVTALGFADGAPAYTKYWEEADERLHFVGKEIIRFHCLYWPAMLKAAVLPVPTRVFAHGWLTKGGKKLSKTTGNIIDPDLLIDRYGVDAVRYFFMREGSFGQDWDFTEGAFQKRFNSDLANDLGNLVSRALTMVVKYCDGKVPPRPEAPRPGTAGLEAELQDPAALSKLQAEVFAAYEALDFAGALSLLWSWVSRLNVRIAEAQPWVIAKDASRRAELDAFLYRLLEGVRLICLLAAPVTPQAAAKVRRTLGLPEAPQPADLWFGRLEPGTTLQPVTALFPRLEADSKESPLTDSTPQKEAASVAGPPVETTQAATPENTTAPSPKETPGSAVAGPPAQTTQAVAPEGVALLDIADFARVELRAARVVSAEPVPKSKKLLKLQVDLGDEQRQIVSGIADAYAPDALVGKTIVLVSNLKPAKLMGVESNGMVLAASHEGKAVLCIFDGPVPPGTKVR